MASKVILNVPAEISEQSRQKAHQAAVLTLWQEGALTLREAALELDLSYRDFLDLLAAQGLPVVHGGEINVAAIEAAERKLAHDAP
jgi:predicted HTH domain antitoxin